MNREVIIKQILDELIKNGSEIEYLKELEERNLESKLIKGITILSTALVCIYSIVSFIFVF